MAQVIKRNVEDLNDNLKRSDLNALPGFNLIRSTTVGIGETSNQLNDVGQTVDGSKARTAADAATTAQNNAQADAEAAMRHQKRLAENSADFRRQRNAQKIAQMVNGGRAGTLLNGTAGVQTLGGAAPGSKTLLGQ